MSNNGHSQTRWVHYQKLLPAPLVAVLLLTAAGLGGLYSPVTQPQLAAAETPFTDFNGDGFADLAIGVPQESLGSVGFAGAVNVIYGSSQGLKATAVAAGNGRADQFWTQNSANIEGFAEVLEGFGSALATGDFNDDGFTDLAIGVPFESVGTVISAGAVNVIYGSSQGLKATAVAADDGRADQFWTQNTANVEDSAEASDRFGSSLATGDFNNDGFADLAIGVPFEDLIALNRNLQDTGAVNVIYGSSNGLSATAVPDMLIFQSSGDFQDPPEDLDQFGKSLSTGDFNNDGFADLAVGVPNEDVFGNDDAGAVSVIYGSSSGLSFSIPGQTWTQDSADVIAEAEPNDQFGSALATGDFNNDGYDDLAIGVPTDSVGIIARAGFVNVIYGSSSGLSATAVPNQGWAQDENDIEDDPEDFDNFGSSLAAGDFNNDGFSDLAIGVPREDIISNEIESGAGAVNVIYGSTNGLSATAVPDQLWTQNSPDIEGTPEQEDDAFAILSDEFGFSIAAGDFNNDGKDDLAIGVPTENLFDNNDNIFVDAGAVNVIYGSSSGLSATAKADQLWHQNSFSVEDTIENFDIFGASLASG